MSSIDKTKREKERFVALSFCRADLLFELNDNREIIFVAGAAKVLLGKTPEAIQNTLFIDYVTKDYKKITEEMFDIATNKGRLDDVKVTVNGPGKARINMVVSGYRVPDFNNHFFLALKVDTQRHIGKIQPLVSDEETGLLETESFSQAASERVSSFIRAGGDAQVSMVKVNHLDTMLNKVGATDKQKLLGEIGSILNENSLGGDMASRIDGDSFSFAHASDVDTNAINMQIEALAKTIDPEAGDMVQAISSTLDVDGAGMSEDQVARALIHTMTNFCENKGTVRETALSDVLSGMMTNTVKNVSFIKEVSKTMDMDIFFMPINDLKKGYVHHFEGLVRFKGEHEKKSPFHLICLAEEIGIICDLDMAIVRKSIERVHHFRQKKFLPPVAINLSGASLGNDQFMATLHQLLKDAPEMSGHLMFEITESAKIEDLPKVNKILQSIRDMRFEVCLDDFGAGAASFDYLNMLDVDVVKFDGPVVKRAYQTEKGTDLIKAMSRMCHDLNIHTVAEMVEDEAMANHMRECDIDFGQGWHFGKPDPDPIQYSRNFAPESKVRIKK